MPGQFNPDKNLFSVAPVANIVIIGRAVALKGGLSREYALNLATWLLIATGASPEEVKAGIQDAMIKIAPKAVVGNQRTVPQPSPAIPAEVQAQVTPFIGEIDPEEAASLQEAVKAPTVPTIGTLPKVVAVDPDSITNAWGGQGNG